MSVLYTVQDAEVAFGVPRSQLGMKNARREVPR
jgi:hypothetical protein